MPSKKDWSWIFHCLNVKTPEEAEVDLNDSLEENYVCDNDDRDYFKRSWFNVVIGLSVIELICECWLVELKLF